MTPTSSTPPIDMIVPLYYNTPKLYQIIAAFFQSIKEHYPNINLIVVDDCSPLDHDFPVTYRNETNKGFTATVNKGLELSTAPVLIVANDDLEFKPGDLDRFSNIGLGIYSPADTASGNLETFGAIWGMTRQTYHLMGQLDEKYRHFYSDKEYYNRAKYKDLPVIKWPDICVTHHESATYNTLNKTELLEEDKEKYGNG